ncbi:MAG: hypothetical protein CRN43_07280 [Candidatus Nephrothrix sp. EaCA]|nr:MAG: hypothetical protein CRN43_07280 [Candidatus Nephrothrix sp. EaCA]
MTYVILFKNPLILFCNTKGKKIIDKEVRDTYEKKLPTAQLIANLKLILSAFKNEVQSSAAITFDKMRSLNGDYLDYCPIDYNPYNVREAFWDWSPC